MTDDYSVVIRVSGNASNHVESFLNDVRKRADEGRRRYGVDLDIERIELQEETDGFKQANK